MAERPSLRDERRQSTRDRIVEAAAELVREAGDTDVALTAVAARAGIGERTLYRYFATKTELFAALFSHLAQGATDLPPAEGADALVERSRSFFTAYDAQPELLRAMNKGGDELRRSRAEYRRQVVRTALGPAVEALPEPRRTQVLAAVHLVTSSDAYLHAKDYWDLDADAVGELCQWVVSTLVRAALEEEQP